MGKCLTIKLTESVSSPRLHKMNEVVYKLKKGTGKLLALQNGEVTLVGNCYFNSNDSYNIKEGDKTYIANRSNSFDVEVTVKDDDSYLKIALDTTRTLSLFSLIDSHDADDVALYDNIQQFADRTGTLKADLSEFSNCTQYTFLEVQSNDVTGDIASLGSLVNLTELRVLNSSVTGDIASLAASIAKAKIPHTLKILTNANLTNGDKVYARDSTVIVTFSADGTYTIA